MTQVAIITNCTARKRGDAPSIGLPNPSASTPLPELAGRFAASAAAAPFCTAVDRLYAGRSFKLALRAAACSGANLFVASAGFGLVNAAVCIPNYNITVAVGKGSVVPILKAQNQSATAWWAAITRAAGQHYPIATLIESDTTARILIALPSTYLALIADDLAAVSDTHLGKIRIFTAPTSRNQLALRVRPLALPYDQRLDRIPRFAGTKSDFAQRALSHFVEVLHGMALDIGAAQVAVNHALAFTPPGKDRQPARQRASDVAITAILRANWHSNGGRATQLLRHLRDRAGVACEQRRFQALYSAVATEFVG